MIKWRYYPRHNMWRAFWVEEQHHYADCVAVILAVKAPRRPGGRPVVVEYQGQWVHALKGYNLCSVKVSYLQSPRIVRKSLVDSIESSLRRYACECGAKVPACRTDAFDDNATSRPDIRWAHHVCAKDWPGRKADHLGATVLPKYEKASPIVDEAPSVNPNDGRDPIVEDTLPHEDPIGNPQRAAGGTDRLESSARSQDDDTRDGKQTQTRMAGFTDLYNLLFAHPSEASRANGARYLRASECADLRERVRAILSILENIEGDL